MADKEKSILQKIASERIVEFWANNGDDPDYPKGLHISERCDTYYCMNLTKSEAQQMINELQELVNLIAD